MILETITFVLICSVRQQSHNDEKHAVCAIKHIWLLLNTYQDIQQLQKGVKPLPYEALTWVGQLCRQAMENPH